jgi:lactate dehydrogenase-like 2-hydroxyacid dehydrogenase
MAELLVNLGGLRDVFVQELAGLFEMVEIGDPRAKTATAAVTTGGGGISAAQVAALPKLRLVAGFGVGYDKVDIPACKARGIVVTNTPGLTDICVADHAMALYLAVARRVVEGDRFVPPASGRARGSAGSRTVHRGASSASSASAGSESRSPSVPPPSTCRSAITTGRSARTCRTSTSTACTPWPNGPTCS